MLLKKRAKAKANLEITVNCESRYITLVNVPDTDRFILEKKNDYLTLYTLIKSWIDENKFLTEKQYKSYYYRKLGLEFPVLHENISDFGLEDYDLNSNLFSNCGEDMEFNIEKFENSSLEDIYEFKWHKNMKKKPLGSKAAIVPTIDLIKDFDFGYKRVKVEEREEEDDSGQNSPNFMGAGYMNLHNISASREVGQLFDRSKKTPQKKNEIKNQTCVKLEHFEEEIFNQIPDSYQNSSDEGSLDLNRFHNDALPTSFFEETMKRINTNSRWSYVFIGGKDGGLKRICMESKRLNSDYGLSYNGMVSCLIITPDMLNIFTGGNSGHLKQWSLNQEECIRDLSGFHKYWIRCMTATPDSEYLFTGSDDFSVKQWVVQSGHVLRDWQGYHNGTIMSMAISNKGEYLFTGDFKGHIKKMEIESGVSIDFAVKAIGGPKTRAPRQIHRTIVKDICIDSNDQYIYTLDKNGFLYKWDLVTNELIREYGKTFPEGVLSACLTIDNQKLQVSTKNGKLKILEFHQKNFEIKETVTQAITKRGRKANIPIKDYNIKDYGILYKGSEVFSISLGTEGQDCFYTCNGNGNLKKWSCSDKKLLKDYGRVYPSGVNTIKFIADQRHSIEGSEMNQMDIE